MKLIVIILLCLIIVIEACAEIFLTKASNTKNNKLYIWLGLGILTYIIVSIIFYFLIKERKELGKLNTIWQGANIVLITLFSIFFLKEHLSIINIIGIITTIIGIMLVNWK